VNDDFESLTTPVPGPRSLALAGRLSKLESRNVTYLADDFPIFWESGAGATIVDVDGNRYLDFTSAFGVANVGHANPRVTAAIADQAARLAHGMGDVHPTKVRVRLMERLGAILPPALSKTYFASTGSEAVEAALKTAMLATGRSRFASYSGAYHGLSLGTLPICGIEKFREPFSASLGPAALLLDYPSDPRKLTDDLARTAAALDAHGDLAALVVEPIQGRAGCVVPPLGYLAEVRALCDRFGIVMIVDEIYTGFGRTGAWFAIERDAAVPDIICIGKAMGSGFPISAAIGKPEIMDAWPLSAGEALHTSTYLGNPMGCAAALATIDELEARALPARAAALGEGLGTRLQAIGKRTEIVAVRGRGLLWGIEFNDARTANAVVRRALRGGLILLQSGSAGCAITLSPPLVISERQLERGLDILEAALAATK
jgi:4-aminobutyrate aminotransferase-like enzyme